MTEKEDSLDFSSWSLVEKEDGRKPGAHGFSISAYIYDFKIITTSGDQIVV
jgi:hypothetical protein